MGAAGHIKIFNWTKAIEKYPQLEQQDSQKDEYLRLFIGGYIYANPFAEGNRLLVTYNGDNLYDSYGIYWSAEDRLNDVWGLYDKPWWNDEVKEEWIEIGNYILKECEIIQWEVWT
jgi:hypothetical protein